MFGWSGYRHVLALLAVMFHVTFWREISQCPYWPSSAAWGATHVIAAALIVALLAWEKHPQPALNERHDNDSLTPVENGDDDPAKAFPLLPSSPGDES